jgi:hypothetical protein
MPNCLWTTHTTILKSSDDEPKVITFSRLLELEAKLFFIEWTD